MLYAALTFWLLVIVFCAGGVHRLWSGLVKPRVVNSILLPGTLVAQLGHVLGLLVTGNPVKNTKLMGDDEAGEPKADTPEQQGVPVIGPIVVGLLPLVACGACLFVAAKLWGGTILAGGAGAVEQKLPLTLGATWEMLRGSITLVENMVDAILHSNVTNWHTLLFLYLAVCLTVRMAPFEDNRRGALGAIVLAGVVIAIIGSLSAAARDFIVDSSWSILSFAVAMLLFLLLLSLLAAGVVGPGAYPGGQAVACGFFDAMAVPALCSRGTTCGRLLTREIDFRGMVRLCDCAVRSPSNQEVCNMQKLRTRRLLSSLSVCFLTLLLAAALAVSLGGCPSVNPNTDGTDDGNNNGGSIDDGNDGTNSGGTNNGGTNNGGTNNGGTNNGGTTGDDGGDDVGGDDTVPAPTTITLQRIVGFGDAVPDQSGATFSSFGSPIVDADGRVAFWALYSGGSGHGGLYVWNGTALTRVVDDDSSQAGSVPGGSESEYFGSYQASGDYDPLEECLTWGSAGRLLFSSRVSGGSGRTALFRWRASDADMIVVADTAMIQEGIGNSSSVFISYFANFGVTDSGLVLFRTRYVGLSPSISGNAVCTSNGLAVTPLAQAGDDVPDHSTAAFGGFNEIVTVNPGGYMLFQGTYSGGDGTHGIFLSNEAGTPQRVIDNRPSSSFPGLPTGARIGKEALYYDAMAIGTNGHIAVQALITAGSDSHDAVILWDWSTTEWRELKAGELQVTALLSGVSDGGAVVGLAGGAPYIVDGTTSVSIAATLPTELTGVDITWGETDGAINNSGHAIVPYTRTDDGTPGLGFWTNDELLVLADPAASLPSAAVTAITATSLPENDRPGRSGTLNDSDQAVFRVTITGSGQAIYMGTAN